MVPTTSNTPTTASSPAAVVSGIPWSCAEGMKWVPMRPLVVAPQMANPATRAQNVRTLPADTRVLTARRAGLDAGLEPVRERRSTGRGWTSPSGGTYPYGSTPRSAGEFRSQRSTNGTAASADAATSNDAARHPDRSVSSAMSGRKTSCPVALPAVRTPDTRPRRLTNQVSVTTAANTRAIDPVPRPISTPQVRTICHGATTRTLNPAPAATTASAVAVTARTPNRSISAAAKGAVSPNSTRLTATALESVARDQPNSSCIGTIITLGAARNPAAPTRARKATPAPTQAGWMRRRPAPAAPRARAAPRALVTDARQLDQVSGVRGLLPGDVLGGQGFAARVAPVRRACLAPARAVNHPHRSERGRGVPVAPLGQGVQHREGVCPRLGEVVLPAWPGPRSVRSADQQTAVD